MITALGGQEASGSASIARCLQGSVDHCLLRRKKGDFLLARARRDGAAANARDFRPHMRQGIDGDAIHIIFEVQMGAGRQAGIARQSDHLTLRYRRADRDHNFREMRIGRFEALVLDANVIAEARHRPGDFHFAVADRTHLRADRRAKIDAGRWPWGRLVLQSFLDLVSLDYRF